METVSDSLALTCKLREQVSGSSGAKTMVQEPENDYRSLKIEVGQPNSHEINTFLRKFYLQIKQDSAQESHAAAKC